MSNTLQIKRRTSGSGALGSLAVGELGVDLTDSNKLYVGSSSGNQLLNPSASTSYLPLAGGDLTGTLNIGNTGDEKIVLKNSNNPYVMFQQGTTNKGFIQWNAAYAFLEIANSAESTNLRLDDTLQLSLDGGSYYDVLTSNTGLLKTGGTLTGDLTIAHDSTPTLLLRANTVDSANSGKISFRENSGGTTGADIRYNGATNKLIFDTSDVSNALVLDRVTGALTVGSNLGINGSSATDPLSVKGESANDYVARFYRSDNGNTLVDVFQDSSNHGHLFVRNSAGLTKVKLFSDGVSYFRGGNLEVDTRTDSNNASAEFTVRSDVHASVVADRNANTNSANFMLRTAGVNKWRMSLGMAGSGNETFSIYDEANTANVLTIAQGGATTFSGTVMLTSGAILTNHSSNNNYGFQIKSADNTQSALELRDNNNNWKATFYGATSAYGFLDGPWGNWDIRKAVDGVLQIDQGSGLETVLTNATGLQLTGGTLTGDLKIDRTTNASSPLLQIENDANHVLQLGVVRSAAGTGPNTGIVNYPTAGLRIIKGTGTDEKARFDSDGALLINTTSKGSNTAGKLYIGSPLADSAALAQINGLVRLQYLITHASGTGASDHSGLQPNTNNTGNVGNTSFRYYGAYFNVGDFSGNLTVGGSLYLTDTNTRLHEGGDNSLRITTNSGYVDIGPMNSSFSHFQTDRGQFYFNKQLNVDGHVLPYSNNTYYSGLSTNRWANVYSVAGDFSGTVSIGSHLTHSGYVQYKNGSTNSGIIGSSSLVAANTTPASDLAIRSSGALRFIVSDNWASPKFELAASTGNATFSGNLTVSGTSTFHGSLDLQDNDKLLLGAGNDLEIYHDGSHSYVSDVGTGHLRLTGTNVLIEDGSGTDYIYAASDAVTLYNAGNIKLQTTSAGVSITGNLTVSGTISAGSNADTLDNLDSTQFLRSDANDTTTGRLTIANTSGADGLVIAGGENTGLSARLFFETGTGGQGVSLLNIGGILDFRTGATAGSSSGTQRMQMSTSGLYPFTDAAFTLGTSAKKWSVIYGDKVRVDSHTTMGAASSDSANMSNAAILVGTTGTGIGIDSNEITGVGGTMYINSLHNNGIRFYAGTAGASTNVQVARFENDLVRFYQPVELDSNLKLAGDSASRISFGSKIAIEGQISNNNLDLGESFANIRLRSSADVFPTASVNLGTSSNRWSTIYGAAGNFSGTVTATAFSGTADKSDMVTGSAFATTGSPSSVLEYQQAASVTDTKLAPTSDWYNTIRMGHGNPYSYYSNTIAVQMTGTGAGQIRTQLISNNNAQGWRTVWDDANDGAGSGLDADLLDGQHGSHYLAAANLTGTPPNTFIYGDDTLGAFASSTFAVNPPRMGFFNINNSSTENPDGSSYWQGLHFRHNNQTSTWGWQLTGTYNTSYDSLFFRQITNGTRGSWNRIWSSNNDGSGSGLDADKLDGLQATSFLRSDADDTTTGNLTVGGTLAFNSGTFSGETDLGLTGADHTLYSGEGDNELRFGRSSAECMRFYVNDYHAYFDLIQDADSNQDHYVYFRNQASGTGARGFKFEGGPVGINTIPNAASYLHVNGWSIFESGSSLVSVRLKSSAGEWDIDNNNGTFGLQWAGGDKLTLSNSGNLTVGGTLDVNGSGQQMASFGNTSARCGIEVKSSQWCEVFFTNSSYANSARIGMAYDSSHSSGTVNGDWYVYQPNVSTMDLIVKRAGGVTLCSSGHTTTVGGSLTVTKSLLGVSNSGLSKIGNIVLDTNGEDLPVINHQLNNDLALMDVKGGTVTYGGLSSTPSTGGTGNVFESDSTFLSIYRSDQTSSNPRISNASDGFTITLESLPKNLSYTTRVGITFAHSGWRCSYVKIEVYRAGAWTQIREETNNTGATVYQYYNTAGSAISKIRYTLKNPATTYLRIVSLFAFNYNSYGNSGYFLSQAGGTIYGSATVNSNLTVGGNVSVTSTGTETAPTMALGYGYSSAYRLSFYTDTEAGYISNKHGNNGIRFRHRQNTVMQVGYGTDTSTPYVGIGTVTPSASLHIKNANPVIRLEDSDPNGVYGLLDAAGGDFIIAADGGAGSANSFISFRLDGTAASAEKVRITSTGLGIGTTSPSSKLHVNSEISCGADDNNRAMFGYTPSRFYLGTRQSGTNYLNTVSVTSGKVGIGESSPWSGLHVKSYTYTFGSIAHYNVTIASSNTYTNGHAGGILFAGAYNSSETQTTLAGVWASRPNAGNGQYGGMVHIGGRQHGTSNMPKVLNVNHEAVGIGTVSPDNKVHILEGSLANRPASNSNTSLTIEHHNNTGIQFFSGTQTQIRFGDASNTAAGAIIYKHDDDNFKLNFSNGGHLTINDGSGEIVRVTSDNRVGIGATSPNYKLDIGGTTASTNNTIRLAQANGGTAIRVGAGGGSSDVTLIRIDGESNAANHVGATDASEYGFSLKYMGSRSGNANSLSIFSDNQTAASQVEALTVLQDGKIGIGVADPSANLHVLDNVANWAAVIKNSNSNGYGLSIDCSSNTGTDVFGLATYTGAGTGFFVKNTGKVGIGTTSPANKLTITDGATPYTTANVLLQVKRNASNGNDDTSRASLMLANNSNGFHIAYGGTTDRLRFIDGGNNEMVTFKNGGDVGIGTINPDSQLQIMNNDGSSYRLGYGGTSDVYFDADDFYFRSDNGGANQITKKGANLGIGTTSPSSKLHVVGDSAVATTKAEMNSKSMMKLHHNNPSTTSTNMQLAGVGGGMGLQVTNYNDTANWDIYLNPFGGNVMIGSNRDPNGLLELRSDNSPRMILGYHTGTNAHRIYWDSSKLYLSADHEGDVDNSELRFLVDGSLKAQILSDGRFGIGASPSYTFDVYKSVTGNWLSRIYNTATSGNSSGLLVRMDEPGSTGIAFGVYANGGYKFRVEPDGETQILSGSAYTTHLNYQNTGSHYISTGNSGFTIFRGASNGVTAMRVNGDGKVSINSGSNNGYNLYVNGTSYFNSGSTQNPATLYTSQSTGGNYLLFNNASGQLGYVGWGSTGNNDLYIVNQGGSNTGAIRLYAGGSTKVLVASDGDTDITGRLGVGGNHSGSYGLYVHGTSYFGNNIYGADADYLAVFGRARVGYIGWTDYAGFAHRDQAAQTTYALLQDENGSTFLNSASGQSIYFRQANSNVGGIVSGNWGLGTISPGSYKLYVNGTTYLGGNSVLNGDLFFGSTSGSVITTSSGVLRHLGDNGVKLETYSGGWQERLVIADDGDIDIAQKLGVGGSHSNSYALYVTGDTKITGNFRAESYIWAKGGIKDDGGDHGTDGQVLSTDGSGAVHWVDQSSGSGSGTVNSGTAEQMAFYASNGTAVSGTSAFTFENSTDEEFNIGNGSSKGELCIGGGVGETSADYRLFVNGGIKFDEELCSESGIIKFQSNSSGTETTEMIMSSSGLTVNNSSSQTDSTYALYVSGGIKNSTGGLYVTGDGYISSRLGVATSVDTSYGIKVAGYIASYGHTTWSDYRLKDNTTLWNTSEAATLVKDVPVYSYRWNDNCEAKSVQDQDRIGFLAHEVSEKINKNNLVINEKDGEKYQSVNQTDMIPILWAALQDALKRIEELEAKL